MAHEIGSANEDEENQAIVARIEELQGYDNVSGEEAWEYLCLVGYAAENGLRFNGSE